MTKDSRREEYASAVRSAGVLAGQNESGRAFVLLGNDRWTATADARLLASFPEGALMVYADGTENYVQSSTWREVLALHQVRAEAQHQDEACRSQDVEKAA